MEKIKDYSKVLESNISITVLPFLAMSSSTYDARVENVTKKSILITLPTLKGVPMPVRAGARLDIGFIAKGGKYFFKTKIIERVQENITMVSVELPEYIERTELREFFRVYSMSKIVLYAVTMVQSGGRLEERKTEYLPLCADISGGGLRIISTTNMDNVREVILNLSSFIPGVKEVRGRVVRNSATKDNKFDLGIKFIALSNSDRDRIVQYVFKRQIELRKVK